MNRCLICEEQLNGDLTWRTLFLTQHFNAICETCQDSFKLNATEVCHVCSRPSKLQKCSDCIKWSAFYNGQDVLLKNSSVYLYNSFIKDIMTRWKYRGDYVLGDLFKPIIQKFFEQKLLKDLDKDTLIVPIPLSEERVYTRAFNQAHQMAHFLPLQKIDILNRKTSEKQSKKSRHERLLTQNPFAIHDTMNRPVLLVDDIYTTGRTLRHAAELLIAAGCPSVHSFTLIRS